MYFLAILFTGISLVLSVFLIAVASRTMSKFHSPIFKYLLYVFVILFLNSVFTILTVFIFRKLEPYDLYVYIISDLIILLLFYGVIAKGR